MDIAWCWLCAGQMFLLKGIAIEAGYVGIKHIFVFMLLELII